MTPIPLTPDIQQTLLSKVNWIGTPGKHQERGVALALHNNEIALFWEPGAGKTYATVHVAKTRFHDGQIDLLIVICPNSIRQVWPREFEKWAYDTPTHIQYLKTGKPLTKAPPGSLEVIVIGVEALSQGGTLATLERYMKGRKTMCVMDESSRIKNPSSLRTKGATILAWNAWYRMILTGTPILQGPHDLFSQIRFLNPQIIGITKWTAFKARYCIMGGFENRKIVRYQNLDELIEKITPHCDLVRLKDCTNIPEKQYRKITVPLSPAQRDAIRQLKDEGTLILEDLGVELYVTMALERMTRIQQIVGGSLPTLDPETGKYTTVPLPGNIPKLDAMMEEIEAAPNEHKHLIWARFAPERDRIIAALAKKYGEQAVLRYDGKVSPDQRKINEERIQNDDAARFLVGYQPVAGIGLTMTRAVQSHFYSNTFSAEDRIQTENRNHRTGQDQHCIYTDYEAMVKEDRMITKALALKTDMSEFVKSGLERRLAEEPELEGYV